jgi:hypothetical protein
MAQHHAIEVTHITRDPADHAQPRRFHIACPTCQTPLDGGLTLAKLRARHQVRPGDVLTAACGHTCRLPQPFPAA